MNGGLTVRSGRAGRWSAAAALLALAVPLALTGGAGPAEAAPQAGGISTVAGGTGGPGLATQVGLPGDCGVSYGGGHVLIADGESVRSVTPATDQLTTPAGTGGAGEYGDGGPATSADMYACVAVSGPDGGLLIADSMYNRIRMVAGTSGTFFGQAMTAGDMYTVAGDGAAGVAANGAPATSSELWYPAGLATDSAGNLVIVNEQSSLVQVVAAKSGTFYGQQMKTGDIYTVAGNGKAGYKGDNGPATAAELKRPWGVAVDGSGNLVIADAGNGRIRVVADSPGTFYGVAMTSGDIYTVAGDGHTRPSGNGTPATKAGLDGPQGVAVDGSGNLVIADTDDARVQVVAASSGTFYRRAMTAGDIYPLAGDGAIGYSGDGGRATAAELSLPQDVAVDGSGNVLIADSNNYRVRVVAAKSAKFYGVKMAAGHIYTVAGNGSGGTITAGGYSGDGGPALNAQLSQPADVTTDSAGNEIIADYGNNRIRVAAASTATFYGVAMTAGDLYTVAGDGTDGYSGDGGPGTSAELSDPSGAAADGAGNLLIADQGNNRIRVLAAKSGTFYGQAMTAGDLYTVAGDGTAGYSGDGGRATSAELNLPSDVVADAAGNMLIADNGNSRLRVVAASSGMFYGMAMTAGDIYSVAGGGDSTADGVPAATAELTSLQGVAVDSAGNLVLPVSGQAQVRLVAVKSGTFYGQAMTAGDIYTIAGDGTSGSSGDGGPATNAELDTPAGVALDAAGNVVIADPDGGRVRLVAVKSGTFYGQAMTAGDIYTVAGDGGFGFSGDGGQATSAQLALGGNVYPAPPSGVTVNAAGDLLIADFSNARIREVAG